MDPKIKQKRLVATVCLRLFDISVPPRSAGKFVMFQVYSVSVGNCKCIDL